MRTAIYTRYVPLLGAVLRVKFEGFVIRIVAFDEAYATREFREWYEEEGGYGHKLEAMSPAPAP